MSKFSLVNVIAVIIGIVLIIGGAFFIYAAPAYLSSYQYASGTGGHLTGYKTAVVHIEPFESRIFGFLGLSIGVAIVYFSIKKLD